MKYISVYVVRSGFRENLAGAFVGRDDAIEHIVARVKKNSGIHPEVKIDGTYRVSVPDGWTRDKTPRRVYVLTEHRFEGSGGRLLGFYTTCDKAGKAMKRHSRRFFEEGWYARPGFRLTAINLYACTES